jgi:hypothetical protein
MTVPPTSAAELETDGVAAKILHVSCMDSLVHLQVSQLFNEKAYLSQVCSALRQNQMLTRLSRPEGESLYRPCSTCHLIQCCHCSAYASRHTTMPYQRFSPRTSPRCWPPSRCCAGEASVRLAAAALAAARLCTVCVQPPPPAPTATCLQFCSGTQQHTIPCQSA